MNFNKHLLFDEKKFHEQVWVQKLLNRVLNRFRIKVKASPIFNNGTDMVSEFQRINLFHLLNRVLQESVEGAIVELGCFDGQTGTLFQFINTSNNSNRELYLFDNFQHDFGLKESIKDRLIKNFENRKLPFPIIVEGYFQDTMSKNLPEKICFLHIDCGHGGNIIEHKKTVLECLNQTYHRMSYSAIGVLMDYHDSNLTLDGVNSNPGVKMACDEFFADKPEKVFTLYGGEYSHGYFIKGKKFS